MAMLLTLATHAGTVQAAELSGRILDPQGAVVAGARLYLFDRDAGTQHQATTRMDGTYSFPNLAARAYLLQGETPDGSLTAAPELNVASDNTFDLAPARELNLLFHLLCVLCALAAAVFATGLRGYHGAIALVVGFLVGTAFLSPAPGWTGIFVGAVSVMMLAKPGLATYWLAAPLASGLAGGLWAQLLAGYGLPVWLSFLAAVGLIAVSAFGSRHALRFPRPLIHEDVLVALTVLAVTIAIDPGLTAGWRTAQAMNLGASDVVRPALPPGIVVGLLAVGTLGGLHTLWRRR